MKQGVRYYKRCEYEIAFLLTGKYSTNELCKEMGINRSGFYKWKNRILHPSQKEISRMSDVNLFKEYHERHPSHGYRWLNAKIKLETGVIYSDNYAHKCCKYAGIKSKAIKLKYKKPQDASRFFPNLLLQGLAPVFGNLKVTSF